MLNRAAAVLLWFGVGAAAWAALPGSLDTTYQPVLDGEVRAIVALPDGKAIIGGRFQTVNGLPRAGLARLNADGTVDLSFNPTARVGGDTNWAVNAIVAQADGKLVIGGSFTSVNGAAIPNLARLNADGTLIGGFSADRVSDPVQSLAVQADGKVLVGGAWVCRFNPDGSWDRNFAVMLERYDYYGGPSGFTPHPVSVGAIIVQPNQQIVIQGNFCNVNGFMVSSGAMSGRVYGVARLNPDGTRDESFPGGPSGPYMGWGLKDPGAGTTAVARQQDGSMILGGRFVSRLIRVNSLGTADASFSPQIPFNGIRGSSPPYPDNSITFILAEPSGKILVSGVFDTVDDEPQNCLACFNAAGGLDDQFDPGAGLDKAAEVIVVQADSRILLGGGFTNVNGVARPYLARLHGDDATPRPPAIAIQPVSQNVAEGGSLILHVGVDGPSLRYQWRFNEVGLVGATRARLVLRNLDAADTGSYTVVVSNDTGSVISTPAEVRVQLLADVLNTPGWVWHTQLFLGYDASNEAGWAYETNVTHDGVAAVRFNRGAHASISGSATTGFGVLETTVVGPGGLTYWYKGPGITGPGLPFAGTDEAISEWRSAKVELAGGTQTLSWAASPYYGTPAFLDEVSFVSTAPVAVRIVNHSTDQTVVEGANVVLSLAVIGPPPFEYQWSFNGVPLDGATNATLTLSRVSGWDSGSYAAWVGNAGGSDASGPIRLAVRPQYLPLTVSEGTHVVLNGAVILPPPVEYQWSFNGNEIPCATNATLVLSNVSRFDSGTYVAKARNARGTALSEPTLIRVLFPYLTLTLNDSPVAMAFAPGGQTLAAGRLSAPDGVWLRRITEEYPQAVHGTDQQGVGALAFSPDGTLLTLSASEGVTVWRVADGLRLRTVSPIPLTLFNLAYGPNGQLLGLGINSAGQLGLWQDVNGGIVRMLGGAGNGPRVAVFSSRGEVIASGSLLETNIQLWRALEGTLATTLSGPGNVAALAFAPVGGTLAAGGAGNAVRLWNLADGTLLRDLILPDSASKHTASALAFAPDGSTLAAGYSDGRLAFWRIADGALLRSNPMGFVGSAAPDYYPVAIKSIAFSPDGQYLAFTPGGIRLVVARNPLAPAPPASVRLVFSRSPNAGGFPFIITGQPGASYQMERSADLKQWLPWTVVTNLDGTVRITDPEATNRARSFYRAVIR